MTVDALVATLRTLRDSPAAKKTGGGYDSSDTYACVLRSLYDEYRFFHKYPDRELHTTGEL